MSYFLPAGMINDSVGDLSEKVAEVRTYYEQRDMVRLKKALLELENIVLDLAVFLERLTCQPLIFTGKGSTEEVIKRLEWALQLAEKAENPESGIEKTG